MIQTLKVCFTIANSEEGTAEHRFIQEKTVGFLQDYLLFQALALELKYSDRENTGFQALMGTLILTLKLVLQTGLIMQWQT